MMSSVYLFRRFMLHAVGISICTGIAFATIPHFVAAAAGGLVGYYLTVSYLNRDDNGERIAPMVHPNDAVQKMVLATHLAYCMIVGAFIAIVILMPFFMDKFNRYNHGYGHALPAAIIGAVAGLVVHLVRRRWI